MFDARDDGGGVIAEVLIQALAGESGQLLVGYSSGELQRVMEQDWDSGRGPFGSAEMRQSNAEFLLTVAKLVMYARKHFGKPKENKTK